MMEVCHILLQEVWEALGIQDRERITDTIFLTLAQANNQKDWERMTSQLITPLVNLNTRKVHWKDRAERISSWFQPYLNSPVLEFGCDDGVVGKTMSLKGYEVTLADVFEHENIKSLELPYYLYKEGTNLPFSKESFQSVTLSSVLHHCNNPIDTIRESKRLLKDNGILLVSESVYCLNAEDLQNAPGRLHIHQFAELSPEQQLGVNIFFEIIYHRILNFKERDDEMIQLPYNYLPAKNWPDWFKEQDLQTIAWWPIGISHKIGPLCHAVYILQKKR
jgi:SAM-dependent methyltransferase